MTVRRQIGADYSNYGVRLPYSQQMRSAQITNKRS